MAERSESNTENVVIDHFTAQETENGEVMCNLCDFTCGAVESIQLEHLIDKHGYKITEEAVSGDEAQNVKENFYVSHDDDDQNDESVDYFANDTPEELAISEFNKRGKSSIWYFFSKTDPKQHRATCNFCKKNLSYRTSVTNLTKHLLSQHSVEKYAAAKNTVSSVSEGSRKLSTVWKYFEVCDAEDKMATCLMCDAKRSFKTSITNLKKHVERKHQIDGEIDPASQAKLDLRYEQTNMKYHNSDESDMEQDTLSHIEIAERSGSQPSSLTWLYFKQVDTTALVECQICHQRVSYDGNTAKMNKHLLKKHPDVDIPEKEDGSKRTLLSSNGQLFEVNIKGNVSDDPDYQEENTEPYTEFLEEFDVDKPISKRLKTSSKTPEKNPISDITTITAISDTSKITAIDDSSKVTTIGDTSKITAFGGKSKVTAIDDSNSSSSSGNGIPLKFRKDSLDHFGKYLVSLLRQLPKTVSNKLQADFISQIMQAQSD